ncbi:MAG: tRNA (adenosine(37)-N6)-dimethylallyltransferase MiaA [Acidobacteria bacterium]|nr:tRNA (adenosine(37)-N6)-dimethylallyltransferase MiaA [Acidobacteriota bacterium]
MLSRIGIVGPTASGKTELAERLATERGADIVSVDSMQVYRGMDIGTAKPSKETRSRVAYHLIDLVEPKHDMSVAQFQAAGRQALETIESRGRDVVIAGGSGLHMRSLIDPLVFEGTDADLRTVLESTPTHDLVSELTAADADAASVVDLANRRRVVRAVEILRLSGRTPTQRHFTKEATAVREYEPIDPIVLVGVDPGDAIEARVAARCQAMFAAGLLEEVRSLQGKLGRAAAQAVGYKELVPVIEGRSTPAEGLEYVVRATLALVKQQRTYFRRDPRVRWLVWHNDRERRWSALCELLESAE